MGVLDLRRPVTLQIVAFLEQLTGLGQTPSKDQAGSSAKVGIMSTTFQKKKKYFLRFHQNSK